MNLDWIKVLPSKETPFNKEFFEKLSTSILDYALPIGRTVIFYDAEDHSNYLGFKWEMVCIGKTPVGIDSNDTDFNTIGKTGGSKYTEKHAHGMYTSRGGGKQPFVLSNGGGSIKEGYWHDAPTSNAYTGSQVMTDTFGTGKSGNLQPYEVVAYWKRVE